MMRFVTSLLIVLMLSATAPAALHKFIPGTVPEGENPLVLLDSGDFELADPPPVNSIQYPALQSFSVRVFSNVGPVDFDLLRASTTSGHINLIFDNPMSSNGLLFMQFDVPTISPGDAIPPAFEDVDGIVDWNTSELMTPSNNPVLAGKLADASVAVPEPSAVAFGGLAIGLVGVIRFVRRRLFRF